MRFVNGNQGQPSYELYIITSEGFHHSVAKFADNGSPLHHTPSTSTSSSATRQSSHSTGFDDRLRSVLCMVRVSTNVNAAIACFGDTTSEGKTLTRSKEKCR